MRVQTTHFQGSERTLNRNRLGPAEIRETGEKNHFRGQRGRSTGTGRDLPAHEKRIKKNFDSRASRAADIIIIMKYKKRAMHPDAFRSASNRGSPGTHGNKKEGTWSLNPPRNYRGSWSCTTTNLFMSDRLPVKSGASRLRQAPRSLSSERNRKKKTTEIIDFFSNNC